jgi:hypothetical protein
MRSSYTPQVLADCFELLNIPLLDCMATMTSRNNRFLQLDQFGTEVFLSK